MKNKTNVLIVDDNEDNLLALEAVLEDLDCNMVFAKSGIEALRFLLKQDAAVILMDVNMPAMDGFETARAIRDRERNQSIPIIFVTASFKDIEHISYGYALKAVDYLLKPFDPGILRTKVTIFIELYQKNIQLEEQAELLRQSENHLETLVQERTAQLKAYADRLERSNRHLQEFAYIASHDLQEPLRKIIAFGDRLSNQYSDQLDETGLDYLKRMRGASQRMQNLLNDLLAYSRVATRIHPFETVDLYAITQEVVSNLGLRLEKTKGKVKVGEIPSIEADSNQMYQLLQNLIVNAIKFHQEGHVPEIEVFGNSDEHHCQIFIKDNGIGFDIQYLDRIFKPFQRLHSREEFEGTGMGLAICQRIVERHHGEITADSTPGQGTIFTVTLPIHQTEGEQSS